MANIDLPKDAEGRDIPLDTKVLYDKDNTELTVRSFDFKSYGYNNGWTVFCALGPNFMAQPYGSQELHLHRPDSWEKLEEDLDRCIKGSSLCMYYSPSGKCSVCTISGDESEGCDARALRNIKHRIRSLAAKEG